MTAFKRVYQVVRTIPAGKVMTYGQIAKMIGTTPRVVGFALHANPYEGEVPCHRVVNREGRLAPHFAFGGSSEQYLRLKEEAVHFLDSTHVDLGKSGHSL